MIIEIDMQSTQPIYEQLRDQIVLGIASAQIKRDEALPSVRRLAADLGINLHTVNKAYSVLCDEGYVVMDRRKGATVAQNIPYNIEFSSNLGHRLTIAAAESRCRGVGEEDFLKWCSECYRGTGNDKTRE